MTRASVKVIQASQSPAGYRVLTLELRYPRIILAELNTHRAFSRNSGSSRAIPVQTMLKSIREHPAMPVSWGKNQKGMQAGEENTQKVEVPESLRKAFHEYVGLSFRDDEYSLSAEQAWKFSAWLMASMSEAFSDAQYHKQVANRLTEPFQWMNTVLSATDWENFFDLRVHPDADPTFQDLAFKIQHAWKTAEYKLVQYGEWHLPYVLEEEQRLPLHAKLKLSTARCARVSYTPFDGNASHEAEFERHDLLVGSRPWHASPTEHQCTPDIGDFGNFRHWKQYRQFVEAQELP